MKTVCYWSLLLLFIYCFHFALGPCQLSAPYYISRPEVFKGQLITPIAFLQKVVSGSLAIGLHS